MKAQKITELYEHQACKLAGRFPRSLIYDNQESICSGLERALSDGCVLKTIRATVELDMLKLCNEDPFFAHEIMRSSDASFLWIKNQLLAFLNLVLYQIGIRCSSIVELDYLCNFNFQIKNIVCEEIHTLREFYSKIKETLLLDKNNGYVAKRKSCNVGLVFFEAYIEPGVRVHVGRTKVYQCSNPGCKYRKYVIQKELIKEHIEECTEKAACSKGRIQDRRVFPEKVEKQLEVHRKCVSNGEWICLSVERDTKCISLALENSNLACESCNLSLKERQCYSDTTFKYKYLLHDSLFTIHAYSYMQIERKRCIVIGNIVRSESMGPELHILGAFPKARRVFASSRYAADKVNNILSCLCMYMCRTFACEEKTHNILLTILSIFVIRKSKVLIYTNEVDYIKHYAKNYFFVGDLEPIIKFEFSDIQTSENILFIQHISNLNFKQVSRADFAFLVKISNPEVSYVYQECKWIGKVNTRDTIEITQEGLSYIQKSFISMRGFFRNTISPPKLLNYIHTLSSSFSFLIQKELSQENVQLVESTFRHIIVPDIEDKENLNIHKRICTRNSVSGRASDIRIR